MNYQSSNLYRIYIQIYILCTYHSAGKHNRGRKLIFYFSFSHLDSSAVVQKVHIITYKQ